MAYVPAYVDAAGLHVSSYADILADNIQAYLNIYGANQYVAPDSAIYQLLSILSLKQSDCNAGLQLVYNQSGPTTAVGTGLDRIVKMNGLARLPATYSTAALTVTGTPGFIVLNGVAQDQASNLWTLPSPLTITGGSVVATATCQTLGPVAAEPGTITIMATPQSGWTGVTNAAAAVLGENVEADSTLRARQAVSVALPALTPIASTVAAVLAVDGVTRVAPGYPTPGGPGSSIENPTGSTDSWGNPAHSITIVVEGGTTLGVATAIYLKKTIGCYTHGTTSQAVVDPVTGYSTTISFYRPTYVQPYISMYVYGLTGFTTATSAAIKTALVNYLDSLSIGESIIYSSLYGAAISVMPSTANPEFSIKSLTLGTTAGSGLFTVIPHTGALGTGYVANDVLTVAGGTGGTVTVSSVNGSGGITGIAPQATTPGTGYSVTTNVATTGGTGTGAHVDISAVQPAGTSDLTLLFYNAVQGVTGNVQVVAV